MRYIVVYVDDHGFVCVMIVDRLARGEERCVTCLSCLLFPSFSLSSPLFSKSLPSFLSPSFLRVRQFRLTDCLSACLSSQTGGALILNAKVVTFAACCCTGLGREHLMDTRARPIVDRQIGHLHQLILRLVPNTPRDATFTGAQLGSLYL